MIVEKDKAVSFHYTLKDADGEQMETSRDKDPMSYLHGANNIIPGLEKAMEGRSVNDEFSVTVEPDNAELHEDVARVVCDDYIPD